MGIIGDFIDSLNNGFSSINKKITTRNVQPPAKEHPVTIQELDKLAATIIFFESLKGMHNRMVANRQHEEMMDELQRIGRY
jgi:hypothetical protein